MAGKRINPKNERTIKQQLEWAVRSLGAATISAATAMEACSGHDVDEALSEAMQAVGRLEAAKAAMA